MSQLSTSRADTNTVQEHVDDHNELHRLHNVVDTYVGAKTLQEAIEDHLGGTVMTAGSNVTITYDDTAGTITVAATSGGGAWGSITGTLSSQTDLQTALDGKVATTTTVNGHALSGNVTVSRADLSLDTTDSPQFAGLNVGAAADTTITRTGAGDIAVEGNAIYRAGGTDVPVTDGGTGASTLTNHGVLVGQGTSAVAATAAGTANQLLVSGGAAADPSYKTLASADASVTVTAGATMDLSVPGVGLLNIVSRQYFK